MSFKSFSVAAVALASVATANYQPYNILVDGSTVTKYVRSQDWGTISVGSNSLRVSKNNNVFLQNLDIDGPDYAFTPYIRGGSIEYDIDLMWNDCGCVSGLYLVAGDNVNCTQDPKDNNDVNCPSIDLMQANNYGFNVAANPCAGGNCDALSQCMWDMRDEGIAEYGSSAYGPGGSLINTYAVFHVKTEFLSTLDYQTLWGLRTTISQNGNTITMQKDCRGYIDDLNFDIEGHMSLVFTQWSNEDGRMRDFQTNNCPLYDAGCSNAYSTFYNLHIHQIGSNEDPEPEPVTFHPFVAFTDQASYAPEWEMYVKGLDGKSLASSGTEVDMGFNNKAFVLDYAFDDSTNWAYQHDLLGGSLSYTVDVSNVDCACAAGTFLVNLDDGNCTWDAKPDGSTPQCSSVDLMEANINGFNVASNPCPFGSCDLVSQCSAKVNDGSALNYGSGSGYTIDTSKPYSVRTQFNAYKSADLTTADLQSIVTTLEQEGRSVSLTMDCPEYINELGLLLYYDMNLGISSYALDPSNEVSGGTCANVCASSTNFKIRDITFVANDSILEDPNDAGTPTYAEAAPLLDSGNCGSGCTECRKFYFSKTPEDWSYECVDTTHYQFGEDCPAGQSQDSCSPDEDFCILSWDINDPDRENSPLAKCRSVPQDYMIVNQGDWKFNKRTCRNPTDGLCAYGCGSGSCNLSWPSNDPLRRNSVYAMCRCQN